ncbi:hypothetical protein H8D85_02145 [bacterium]|nr:hypothetical protein [bacterium]
MVLIGDDLFVSTSEGIYTAYKEDLEWSSVGTISTNVSSVISYNNKIYIGKQDGVYSTDIASNYSNSTWTLDYSTSDHVKAIRAGTYIYALTNGSVFSNRDGS